MARTIILLCCMYVLCGWEKSVANESLAVDVVKQYCQLDADGVRLSSKTYSQIRHLMAEPERDEPGWDRAKIVTEYQILTERMANATSIVTIEYLVVADMIGCHTLEKHTYTDRIDVALTKTVTGWKFKKPIDFPRISLHTAITLCHQLLAIEEQGKDVKKIDELKAFIHVLQQFQAEVQAEDRVSVPQQQQCGGDQTGHE